MPFKILKGAEQLSFKSWSFPDGDEGVRLDTENHRYKSLSKKFTCSNPDAKEGPYAWSLQEVTYQTIVARVQSPRDLYQLQLLTDALREWDPTPIRLFLPCFPSQRQDRRCCKGEAFNLRVVGRLINGLDFEKVTVLDPHSDVLGGIVDRVEILDQQTIIGRFDAFNARMLPTHPDDRPILCSPDAGANKKTAALAGYFGHPYFIRADKLRDLATGKIKEIVVVNSREDVEGRDVMIVDDLLDRGGTFIGLTKALMAKGAKSVELYVTHGLFTAEIDSILNPLCEAGLGRIWTTNSYRTDIGEFGKQNLITVLDVEEAFL